MSETDRRDVTIAIAGAGLSGLRAAIALREDGIEDFVVLERADDLGGTWRDNSYPGCACDIASVLYSYSDEPNPGWTRAFAGQAEIWAYMREVARRHEVSAHMRYGHEVLAARWDESSHRWQISTTGGDFTAEILISATGALADPAVPDLPGLDRFEGTVFHSARWDHDHDLSGRRVAVIGTGASAIQFVPEIQPRVGHLALFQRTPPWVLPRGNPPIPRSWQRRFARHPKLLTWVRRSVFSLYESFHYGFRHPAVMKLAERRARAHIAKQVADPDLRAKLTPDYRLGCKRILGSDTWYPALCQANVDVTTSAIAEVTPAGVVDAGGTHHAVDTIIFDTGFQVTDVPFSHRVRGRHGELLADRWQGSPQAHLGMSVTGFPNLFMLLGPNTGLGVASGPTSAGWPALRSASTPPSTCTSCPSPSPSPSPRSPSGATDSTHAQERPHEEAQSGGGRAHGLRVRRGVGNRAGGRAAAGRPRLPGGDRRPGRGRPAPDGRADRRTSAEPQPRCS